MATRLSARVTDVLNATIKAIDSVIPNMFSLGSPSVTSAPVQQSELGVLIGITGEVKGRLFLSSTTDTFGRIGKSMYGMDLDKDMVKSFAAELANMVAGNMVSNAEHLKMDISPPTALEGGTKLYGFTSAIMVPMLSESIGTVNLALMLDNV